MPVSNLTRSDVLTPDGAFDFQTPSENKEIREGYVGDVNGQFRLFAEGFKEKPYTQTATMLTEDIQGTKGSQGFGAIGDASDLQQAEFATGLGFVYEQAIREAGSPEEIRTVLLQARSVINSSKIDEGLKSLGAGDVEKGAAAFLAKLTDDAQVQISKLAGKDDSIDAPASKMFAKELDIHSEGSRFQTPANVDLSNAQPETTGDPLIDFVKQQLAGFYEKQFGVLAPQSNSRTDMDHFISRVADGKNTAHTAGGKFSSSLSSEQLGGLTQRISEWNNAIADGGNKVSEKNRRLYQKAVEQLLEWTQSGRILVYGIGGLVDDPKGLAELQTALHRAQSLRPSE